MLRFYFRLAERLGMSVARLLREVSSYELGQWYIMENMEYYEPRIKEMIKTDDDRAAEMKAVLFAGVKKVGRI